MSPDLGSTIFRKPETLKLITLIYSNRVEQVCG
mgnify:CR=1 FL=1